MRTQIAITLVMLSLLCSAGVLLAAAPVQEQARELQVGQSITLSFTGLTRAAVADPKVVDVAVVSSGQLLLNAKSVGTTTLDAWDRSGQSRYLLVVKPVGPDLAQLVAQINGELSGTGVSARDVNGTVLLEGTVKDPAVAKRAEAVAAALFPSTRSLVVVTPVESPRAEDLIGVIRQAMLPTVLNITGSDKLIVIQGQVTPADAEKLSRILSGITRLRVITPSSTFDAASAQISSGDLISVINMVTATTYDPRQILVHARVVDVDRRALKELGVEWGSQLVNTEGNVTIQQPILFGEARATPLAVNTGGPFRRLDLLGASLTALITQNRAKILSEPNLLVMEGQRANIHLGGEIPIPVVQSIQSGGAPSISVQWKKFGVDLDIEGRIGADGNSVDLMVSPEVSELDFANAIRASGITIPALRSRSATTKVHIPSGQTLVIAGLIQSETAKVVRRIPLLSEIPIIGEFFKRTDTINAERELIILVTPEIVTATELMARPLPQSAVPVPPAPATPTAVAPAPAPVAAAPASSPEPGTTVEKRRHFR